MTRPSLRAAAASRNSPVRLIHNARPAPTARSSNTLMPQLGRTPARTWVSAKDALSDAMGMSQCRASSRPLVTATPLA